MPIQGSSGNPLVAILAGVMDNYKKSQDVNTALQKQVLASVAGQTNTKRRLESEERRAGASLVAAGQRNDSDNATRVALNDADNKRLATAEEQNQALKRQIADHQARLANAFAFFGKDPQALTPEAVQRLRQMLQPTGDPNAPLGASPDSALEGFDPSQMLTMSPLDETRAEANRALVRQRDATTEATNKLADLRGDQRSLTRTRQQQAELDGAARRLLMEARRNQVETSREKMLEKSEWYIRNAQSLIKSRDVMAVFRALGGYANVARATSRMRYYANQMLRPHLDANGKTILAKPEEIKRGQEMLKNADDLDAMAKMATPRQMNPGIPQGPGDIGFMDRMMGLGDDEDAEDAEDDEVAEGELGYSRPPAPPAPPPARRTLTPKAPASFNGFVAQPPSVGLPGVSPTSASSLTTGMPLAPGDLKVTLPTAHHSAAQPRNKKGEFKKAPKASTSGGPGKTPAVRFRTPTAGPQKPYLKAQ